MRDGIIAARTRLLELAPKANRDECIRAITNMIQEFNSTVRVSYDDRTRTWFAFRGSFGDLGHSVFGMGITSQDAVKDLEIKERDV
jgi:hypothetical protein